MNGGIELGLFTSFPIIVAYNNFYNKKKNIYIYIYNESILRKQFIHPLNLAYKPYRNPSEWIDKVN